jgi:hypothetical protein
MGFTSKLMGCISSHWTAAVKGYRNIQLMFEYPTPTNYHFFIPCFATLWMAAITSTEALMLIREM